jgi:hypothetical protein
MINAFLFLSIDIVNATCEGKIIHQSADITVHLSPMGTAMIGDDVVAYRALNQNLILEICVTNLLPFEQRLSIQACPDGRCADKDSLDVKHIVSWYRDSNAERSVYPSRSRGQILVPELLLNDPLLIRNDESLRITGIRTKSGSKERYISNREYESIGPADRNDRILHNPELLAVEDSDSLQPVVTKSTARLSIRQKHHEAINNIRIEINSSSGNHAANIRITEIPINLSNSPAINGIYYRSIIDRSLSTLSSEFKSTNQVQQELIDIKSKGILYPTAYIYDNFRSYMKIRNLIGFPSDKIFVVDGVLNEHRKSGDWLAYERRMRSVVSDELFSNYEKVFFYLADEPDARNYRSLVEKAAPIARRAGAGLFLAGHANKILDPIVPDIIYIVAYEPDSSLSRLAHAKRAKIFSYANPQIGIYKPRDTRLNYGIKIITSGYDGIMPYAYQHSSGSQWSDQDGEYREHMLSYTISNGIVGTVHGLALENAIIDQQYLATYLNLTKNPTAESGCASNHSLPFDSRHLDSNKVDEYRAQLALAIQTCIQQRSLESS